MKSVAGLGIVAGGASFALTASREMQSEDHRWQAYRSLRRGLITLPQLEKSVTSDLKQLARVVGRGQATKLEFEFACQIISTVKESLDETLTALKTLQQFADQNTSLFSAGAYENLVAKRVQDTEVKDWIARILGRYGSVPQLLQQEQTRLAHKQRVYAKSLSAATNRDAPSLQFAVQNLNDFYASELMREVAYWRERLEKAESLQQRGEVIGELCHEAPEIARLLKVQCPQEFPWPVILIAVACALLLAHD